MSVYKFESTLWFDRNKRRELVSDADDISALYLNLGILLSPLITCGQSEVNRYCVCIKLIQRD